MATWRRSTLAGVGALALAATALAGCGPDTQSTSDPGSESRPAIHGDWPHYESVDAATARAELIVVGRVGPSHEIEAASAEATGMPTTVTEVQVTAVLKGDTEVGDRVQIGQTGTATQAEASTTYLADVESPEVLVFLPEPSTDFTEPINPTQGVYAVEKDAVRALPGASDALPVTSLTRLARVIAREDAPD